MLTRLSIRDIVLIDRLDIDFAAGLSALTGETGAGKSILLDAFTLALGARGDAAPGAPRRGAGAGDRLFRGGARPPGAHDPRRQRHRRGGRADPAPRAVRRRPHPRLRQRPAGQRPGAARASAQSLVEIHGQHDERALVDVASHRTLLDAFAALEEDAGAVARAWSQARNAREAVEAHRARVEAARREAEWLRHAVEELTRLKPEPGEESTLAERRAAMMQAEKVDRRPAAMRTKRWRAASLRCPALAATLRRLERRVVAGAGAGRAGRARARRRAGGARRGARLSSRRRSRQADHDPRDLERIEERLFALRGAGRKYDVAVDELSALARALRDRSRRARCGRRASWRAWRARRRLAEEQYPRGRRGAVRGAAEGGRPARRRGQRASLRR